MIIEAEFIGQNKKLKKFEKYKIVFPKEPENSALICPNANYLDKNIKITYHSIQDFLTNWNNIKIIMS